MTGETVTFEAELGGERIDSFVANYMSDDCETDFRTFSRSSVQKLIAEGLLTVNGAPCKTNYKVKQGDLIVLMLPDTEEPDAEPENIPLDVVYEDGDIIVINKPRGMVVHPAAGNYTGTLVNALLYHCKDLSDINGVKRPGIVHRIDKDTTGLIAVAKNNRSHLDLAEQLKDHSMARIYFAIVEGNISENSGTVSAPIGRHDVDRKKMAVNLKNGKSATTHFEVLERFGTCTLVKCKLETGRTHQIRVHMAYIGHPVAGDPVYGIKNARGLSGQALHAGKLTLRHPKSQELVTFEAKLPDDFCKLLGKLRGSSADNDVLGLGSLEH